MPTCSYQRTCHRWGPDSPPPPTKRPSHKANILLQWLIHRSLKASTTLPSTGANEVPPPLHTFQPFGSIDTDTYRQLDYIITSLKYDDGIQHTTDTSKMPLYKT